MYPVLGQVGPVTILTHDALTVLALIVGLSLYYRELARRGWLETRIVWISLAAVIAGAIGARTITAWEHVEYYTALEGVPLSVAIENSGKSLIGALAGGYLGTVLAKRAFGYTRSTGDCYVLAIAVATAIGRVGCFFSELPLGTPTTLPWGVSVSAEAAAAFARCPGCELPMHPSMVYEIVFNLVAVALIVRYRGRIPVVGDTLKLYLLAAGIFRFFVEFVRGNEPQALGLTGPQWVLIPLVGLLIAHFGRQWWRDAWRVPVPPGAVRTWWRARSSSMAAQRGGPHHDRTAGETDAEGSRDLDRSNERSGGVVERVLPGRRRALHARCPAPCGQRIRLQPRRDRRGLRSGHQTPARRGDGRSPSGDARGGPFWQRTGSCTPRWCSHSWATTTSMGSQRSRSSF